MSNVQVKELAKIIVEHSATEELRERIHGRMFKKFRTANPQEREIINYIMDNEKLFFDEIKSIYDANREIEENEDE